MSRISSSNWFFNAASFFSLADNYPNFHLFILLSSITNVTDSLTEGLQRPNSTPTLSLTPLIHLLLDLLNFHLRISCTTSLLKRFRTAMRETDQSISSTFPSPTPNLQLKEWRTTLVALHVYSTRWMFNATLTKSTECLHPNSPSSITHPGLWK